MAASVEITDVSSTGSTATVTLVTSVDNPSQCELNWMSSADSDVEIPFDAVDFSVDAGDTERQFPIDLNIPSGSTAEVVFTANVIAPEVATDQVFVDITTAGGGNGDNDSGIDTKTAIIGLVLLAIAVYVLTG